MSIPGVTRELLVRYLDTWVPGALRAGRRATFVLAAQPATAETALRVLAEFADRLRGRQLTMVAIAPRDQPATVAPRDQPATVAPRDQPATVALSELLGAVQAELSTPPGLAVHVLAGPVDRLLPVALTAAGAAGSPLLTYLETDDAPPIRAATVGRPAELLLTVPATGWPDLRAALRRAGFTLTAGVELVDGELVDGEPGDREPGDREPGDREPGDNQPGDGRRTRLVAFGTSSAKSLEAFKNALWAVDEYAGVRYRDPGDPDGHLLDVSLTPHPGPLRRELLAHLDAVGARTVTELRHFTLTETVYRASDTVRVLGALLTAGSVARDPAGGRLSGDVVISLR